MSITNLDFSLTNIKEEDCIFNEEWINVIDLNLSGANVSQSFFNNVVGYMYYLININLSMSNLINTGSIILTEYNPNIETINLDGTLMTDEKIEEMLSISTSNLKSISLKGTQVSNYGVSIINTKCPNCIVYI